MDMLSHILRRILPVLLIISSTAFALAPGWVAKGVVLEYSVGSDDVTFTVHERNSTDIQIKIESKTDGKAVENAAWSFGQFWFDKNLLQSATKGSSVDEFTVIDTGTETYAGKSWETVTLEGVISKAKTVRVYDKESGLMLKQSVQVEGTPPVVIKKIKVPNWKAEAPIPPAFIQEPKIDNAMNKTEAVPYMEKEQVIEKGKETGESSCIAGAVLLMLAGLVFLKN